MTNVSTNSHDASPSTVSSAHRRGLRRSLLGCAAISAALLSQAALADEAPAAADAAATAPALGDIVVTAQHRQENAQTTPIALSVYSGSDLRKTGINDIQSLTATSPDVSFTQTEGKPIITIRGVSSRDTSENGDPAVTVNVDGFYLNRPYSLNATMYDLERIEVLRGPQGTLNGRNSVGGAVNIVTAKPTDKFEGYVSVAYGNYGDLETQGAINIPVADWLQIRASGYRDKHQGYRELSNGYNSDDANDRSGRLQIAFQPTDRLHGLITGEYTRITGVGDEMENSPYQYDASGSLIHSMPGGLNSKHFEALTEPFINMTEKQVRGNLAYDFDGFTATLLGGYDETKWHHALDESDLTPGADNVFSFAENQYPKTVNAELRFTSKNKSRFQWQFGGFFFQEHSHLLSGDNVAGDGEVPIYSFGYIYKTRASSKAAYAQASYDLTDTLKITGGIRYTHDHKSESGVYGDLATGSVSDPQAGAAAFNKTTFHAEIDDKLTPNNFVYAKFDTGYKAGGFNIGAVNYDPETITAYEIGSKNRFLNDQLQVNLSAYYSDYKGQQVTAYTTVDNGSGGTNAVQLIENAGASHIYGLEGEVVYDLPDVVKLNVNVNWMHARYTKFCSIPDPSDPNGAANADQGSCSTVGNTDLSGNRPPQSPTWSIAGGLEHTFTSASDGSLTVRVQSRFQSASNFSFYNFADTRQKANVMSDAFVTYNSPDDHWSLTAYVKNLENSKVFSDAEESQYAAAYAYEYYAPRTFGLRAQYKW